MKQAFVALGSNLENPVDQIQKAFVALSNIPSTKLVKKSSLYQTAPVDCPTNPADATKTSIPDFINAVAELETDLSPHALLAALHTIENAAGRERPYVNAPRILDCDLLVYENNTLSSDNLTIPHPRMHLRGFVLLPLFEIAPHIFIPNHGKITQLITPELSIGIKKLPPLS